MKTDDRPTAGNVPTNDEDDPYVRLDDLMCVIETLCPQWPQRPNTEMKVAKL